MSLKTAYKEATSGFATPAVMYANGKLFKWVADKHGKPDPRDIDGNLLLDNEVYEFTSSGFRILYAEEFAE